MRRSSARSWSGTRGCSRISTTSWSRTEVGRRLRVAHVITELVVGGAVDNTLLTCAGLDRARYEVHAIGGPGAWIDRARTSSDRVYVVPTLVRPIRPLVDARALLYLAALFDREQYDVVHTHSSKAG